jgi:hypothetical protein
VTAQSAAALEGGLDHPFSEVKKMPNKFARDEVWAHDLKVK